MSVERLLLIGIAAVALAALLPPARPPRQWRRRRPARHRPERPSGLVAMERRVHLAVGSAGEAHERLRPLLREIAAGRLAGAGIDLDRNPAAARAHLGETAWSLIGPDVAAPSDRHARGVDPAVLRETLDALERLRPGG